MQRTSHGWIWRHSDAHEHEDDGMCVGGGVTTPHVDTSVHRSYVSTGDTCRMCIYGVAMGFQVHASKRNALRRM